MRLRTPTLSSRHVHTLHHFTSLQDPAKYVAALAAAGASSITFQIEPFLASPSDAVALARTIRAHGLRAAVAVAVQTPVAPVLPLVAAGEVDMVSDAKVASAMQGPPPAAQDCDAV